MKELGKVTRFFIWKGAFLSITHFKCNLASCHHRHKYTV